MKVGGKPVATSVGVWFIGFALLGAVLLLPGASKSESPLLFVSIVGGLFVVIPAALGIGIVLENRSNRKHVRTKSSR
jgi:hypothetical protein